MKIAIVISHPVQHFCPMYASWASIKDIDLKVFFGSNLGAVKYINPNFKKEVQWSNLYIDEFKHEFLNGDKTLQCELTLDAEIFEKYPHIDVPKHFIHHGLAEEFINLPSFNIVKDNTIRIGLSENWLRTDINTQCLLQIINENPTIFFEFWVSYQAKESNIGR